MRRVLLDVNKVVSSGICPDCLIELQKEIEEHSPFRDFIVYYCPQCKERFTYLAEEE